MVDTGDGEPVQVVCGAPNARTGMKGVFAPPGAFIPGKNMTLGSRHHPRRREPRHAGARSSSCKLSDDHDGIIDLPADAPVGTSYAQWAGLDDPVIEINLTPNRPDCTGVHGIARDLAAADMGTFKDAGDQAGQGRVPLPGRGGARFRRDPTLCPAFALRLVRGVQERPVAGMAAAAARPRSGCGRSTRWSTSPTSSPTTAAGRCMCSTPRRCAAISRCAAPAPAKRCWRSTARPTRSTTPCASSPTTTGVESLAGIMGGEATGCSEATTDVLIESALWEPSQHRADRPQARHQFRRALPLRARRRSGLHAAGARARDADGARTVRRHAVGDHRRGQRRGARARHRFSAVRGQAPRRPRGAAAGDAPRARAGSASSSPARASGSRSRCRRGGRTCRARPTSSRKWCASSASTACRRRRSTAARRRASRC